jgi:hypothetical protein
VLGLPAARPQPAQLPAHHARPNVVRFLTNRENRRRIGSVAGNGQEDEDPAIDDWIEADPTVADGEAARSRTKTAPHDLSELAAATGNRAVIELEREDACRGCYSEGIEATVASMYRVMRKTGLTASEMDAIALAVRVGIRPPKNHRAPR